MTQHILSSLRNVIILLLVVSFPAPDAVAQSGGQAAPAKERKRFATQWVWELGGSVSFQHITEVTDGARGSSSWALSAAPYAGIFLIDGLEAGVSPLGVTIRHENGTTVTDLNLFGSIAYNFRTRYNVYPFVEGLAGYTGSAVSTSGSPDESEGGFSWGGRAGAKLSVTEGSMLVFGVQYLLIARRAGGFSDRDGSDELSVMLGFSVWL